MIIVEGPDGSGKTTLVKNLLEHPDLNLTLAPRACTSDKGAIDNLSKWVEVRLDVDNQKNVIYDRFPLYSDFAYGPLIRGYASEKFDDFAWLHSRFNLLKARHKPMVIFCLPPKHTVLSNIQDTHEGVTAHLRGVLNHAEAIYDLYIQQAALTPFMFDTWVWDYRKDDFSNLCQSVRSYLAH